MDNKIVFHLSKKTQIIKEQREQRKKYLATFLLSFFCRGRFLYSSLFFVFYLNRMFFLYIINGIFSLVHLLYEEYLCTVTVLNFSNKFKYR